MQLLLLFQHDPGLYSLDPAALFKDPQQAAALTATGGTTTPTMYPHHHHHPHGGPPMPPPVQPPSSFGSPSAGEYSPFTVSSPSGSSFDDPTGGFPFNTNTVPSAHPTPTSTTSHYLPHTAYNPGHTPHASTSTARPALTTKSGKPRKRARNSEPSTTTTDDQDMPKRPAGACTHCKRLKMKCEFAPGADRCKRCSSSSNECIVEGRKKPSGPNIRERLLRDIRERDALIAALLTRAYAPAHPTRLALNFARLDPAALARPGAAPAPARADLLAWLDKAERSARRPWDGPLLPSDESSDGGDGGASDDHDERGATSSSDDEYDEERMGGGGSTKGHRRRMASGVFSKPVAQSAIPPDSVPVGVIASSALSAPSQPTALEAALAGGAEALAPETLPADDAVGLENPRYFFPGAGANMGLRRIIIERTMPPEILEYGIVGPEDAEALFELFFTHINPSMALLDPVLHSARATYRRCPFLFTVVCAVAARYYTAKPEIYALAMQFAKKAAASALIDGWKSVEMVQAYLLLGDYAPSARRFEEDRSFIYKGLAIRIASDLALAAPCPGLSPREQRNRHRTWLICWNVDRSGAAQFGRPATLPEDVLVRASKSWGIGPGVGGGEVNREEAEDGRGEYDVHLVAYTALMRIVGELNEVVLDRGRGAMNKGVDYAALTRLYDDRLTSFIADWSAIFTSQPHAGTPAAQYRAALMPAIVDYAKLVMYSFGFQHVRAFQRERSNSSGNANAAQSRGETDTYWVRCWAAATGVVRRLAAIAESGYLTYAPECWFIFGTFAAAFLAKLLRPAFNPTSSSRAKTAAMADADAQRARVASLIGTLARAFDGCAVDDKHAPRLYARFLDGLVARVQAESQGGATAGAAGAPNANAAPGAGRRRKAEADVAAPTAVPANAQAQTVVPPFASQPQQSQHQHQQQQHQQHQHQHQHQQPQQPAPMPQSFEDAPMPLSLRALQSDEWFSHALMPCFGFAAGSAVASPVSVSGAIPALGSGDVGMDVGGGASWDATGTSAGLFGLQQQQQQHPNPAGGFAMTGEAWSGDMAMFDAGAGQAATGAGVGSAAGGAAASTMRRQLTPQEEELRAMVGLPPSWGLEDAWY